MKTNKHGRHNRHSLARLIAQFCGELGNASNFPPLASVVRNTPATNLLISASDVVDRGKQ